MTRVPPQNMHSKPFDDRQHFPDPEDITKIQFVIGKLKDSPQTSVIAQLTVW